MKHSASIGLMICLTIFGAAGYLQGGAITTQSAAATAFSASSGTPSTLSIQENILRQKIAQIQAQIREAERCVATASMPQVLRDPEGNTRFVPKEDIVNCSRQLNALSRQLTSLNRQASKLSQDATAQAIRLERAARKAEYYQRTGTTPARPSNF
jgi:hypothetical protein